MTTTNRPYRIGIDVGGTKIAGVLIDAAGTVLDTSMVPARAGSDNLIDDVVRMAKTLCATPVPVGIGTPGQVDNVNGVVRAIANLNITELALGPEVAARLGVPTHVENDVNAAALGAKAVDAGDVDAHDTVVFLNFGTGLAAGVVCAGKLERGYRGALGEIGHVPVDPNRFLCPCGQHGCLETIASGGAVARLWPCDGPPMPDLLAKASQGDMAATRILDMVTYGIGDAVQLVAQAYDPRVLILGGGMCKTGRPFLELVTRELQRRQEGCHFLSTIDIPSRLRLASTDQPLGAIGAALALDE